MVLPNQVESNLDEPVVLQEYENQPIPLDELDVDFILSEFEDRFRLVRDPRSHKWTLNPRQNVGVVALPSGTTLEIRPKIPL